MADFVANARKDQTIVSGSRGPENLNSARVIAQMDDVIYEYVPEATPFLTLINKARDKRKINNYKFEWLWKDEFPRLLTLTGAALVGDTTLDVNTTDDDRTIAGDVLQNPRTQEVVRVTSVATNTLTVVRGYSSSGEIDMAATDKLMIIGRAAADGAAKGTMLSTKDENEYNYTQIFRHPWGTTGRLKVTNLYGGRDPVTEKKFQAIRHRQEMELTGYFGARGVDTSTYSHYMTMTGGLNYFVKSNRWNLEGTTPTEQQFNRAMEDGMRWGDSGYLNGGGGGHKFLFASSRWMSYFDNLYKDRIRVTPMDKKLGLVPKTIETSHGTVELLKAPALDAAHSDWAFLVDPNHVRYVFMEGRDTRLQDISTPGTDAEEFELLTDCGWQINLEAAHMVIFGLGF
jgi:hypothetical protein